MIATIDGAFEGWRGQTIVKLTNGQVWQQAEYKYEYRYAYRPDVTMSGSSGLATMHVAGMNPVRVRRLR